MSILAVIGTVLQLAFLILTRWFGWNDERKAKAKEILKETSNAKTASDWTTIFDNLNRL